MDDVMFVVSELYAVAISQFHWNFECCRGLFVTLMSRLEMQMPVKVVSMTKIQERLKD